MRDADDLMGRLQSLADPLKATPMDKAPGGRAAAVEPPAPVDADLLDALNDVWHTLQAWERFADQSTLEAVLPDLVNDAEHVRVLGIGFLDRLPSFDGLRDFWSLQDAVDKWGVERRTKGEQTWENNDDVAEEPTPRAEWGDALLNCDDAAKIVGSLRTLQRWERKELIAPEGEIYVAGVRTRLYRRSDVIRVRDAQSAKVGRPKGVVRRSVDG